MTTHYRPPGLPRGVNPGGPMRRIQPARPAHRQPQPYRPPGLPAGFNPGGPMRRIKPAKKAGHAKKARKWSPGVAQCCAARALAASLEALGRPVDGDAVLDLYWRTARTADAGASILVTLEAAAEHGLGDYRLLSFEEVMPCATGSEQDDLPGLCETRAGLILGVDRPGPHAVFGDVPAGAVIEEAWAVTWA